MFYTRCPQYLAISTIENSRNPVLAPEPLLVQAILTQRSFSMSLCKGFTQGGSNADVVLADSYLKNITDGVDWVTGYEAVVSDAEGEGAGKG
jgi:hypothetical protein